MDPKIIVVGAGSAGIAAATRLFTKGYQNLEILEGSNRIGGRINTVRFGANVVDLGGQWCHGERGNVVYELAGPLGLLERSCTFDKVVLVRSNGNVVPQDITDRMLQIGENIMKSKEIERFKGTLGEYFTEKFFHEMFSPENYDIEEKLMEKFLIYFQNDFREIFAIDSWHELTAPGSAAFKECEGYQELSWKGKGYKSVLELLMV